DFRAHEVPLSVCIIDMDWHITDVKPVEPPKGFFPGWTGYTWNRDLFPDPDGFIAWLHEQGLKTALNLHPADGVQPHEAAYPAMARRMGIDPATKKPVEFDIADPDFATAYFELLHHPEEARGVDFWWMDWQQERTSSLPGLDPLWWLNHLHFYDLARGGDKRPFIFSRWGGLGNHRYPIGFSGDTYVNWESLAFQPYFTATAANVGYGWWSHDIGGHMFGVEEGELYARWVQFGLFSPILRLHSTKSAFQERRPWGYDGEVYRVTKKAMRLRHAFIPYLYTMAWLHHKAGLSLVRPMYHDYPAVDMAYHCPQQYMFGTELVAAPFTNPINQETGLARQEVWLPEGDWYDFFSGEYVTGGGKVVRYGRLQDIPVFAKAGAVVPLGPEADWGGVANPDELHIHLFAGADGRFTLYEDDGETEAYLSGAYAATEIRQTWSSREWQITIQAAVGETAVIPEQRTVTFYLHGINEPDSLQLVVAGEVVTAVSQYDTQTETFIVQDVGLGTGQNLNLVLATDEQPLLSRRDRVEEKCYDMLRAFRLQTVTKSGIATYLPEVRKNPDLLDEFTPNLSETQMRALLDVILN
ncbi:MAG: glycoside hydrolase family 31 protein, partial [Anaerolineae bacterium]